MSPFEIKGLNKKMRKSKNLSFEEAFLDMQNDDAETMEDEPERVNYRVLILLILLGFTMLFGRIYFLQAVKGDQYRLMAEGNKLRVRYVLAPRGLITDKNNKTIAGNIPGFELAVIPSDLFSELNVYEAKLEYVSAVAGLDKEEVRKQIAAMDQGSYQVRSIAQDITKDAALVLIGKSSELKGFVVENNPIREYKDPLVFSHVVGYTGKINQEELDERKDRDYLLNDYIGKTGIEVEYEQYLRGIYGQRQNEIDATGIFKKKLAEVPSQPGSNLKLNIDYDLQKKIYDSMVEIMARGKSKKGAAVATNPKTGEVLALVSLPGYDGNQFAHGITSKEYSSLVTDPNIPLLNRVISGTYAPGSTVKPMLGLAALTEGVVKPETKIVDDGVIRVGAFTYYGYNRSGLGVMDLYSAIARSSDIYFYTIGGGRAGLDIQGLGPDKLAEWYRKFSLGQTLGIDLPQEKPGLVPDPAWKQKTVGEQWYLGNTYHYSIGQGDLLVTPLQVNSWTSTLANGGKIMKPYILDQVIGKNGRITFQSKSEVLNDNFLDPISVKVVQNAMRQTITAGSAQSLKNLPMQVAGKTGSAQYLNGNLSATHAWFTSYAPFEDPQIALTVLVEGGGEGSSVSVPISKMVYEWWAQNRYNK